MKLIEYEMQYKKLFYGNLFSIYYYCKSIIIILCIIIRELLLLHNRLSKTYAPSLKGGINTLILRIHVQYKKEYYASILRPTFSARMLNKGKFSKLSNIFCF